MAESITISKLPPPLKSMQYSLLREEGLRHIQELAGAIWTDNNAHDPGITILEVLAYAITDLGYRTNYDIRDILTPNPALPADIRNFFTAAQILPNGPVTFNDYRKLLMDVEVETGDPQAPYAGIKNAWIEISPESEVSVQVDALGKTLSYDRSLGQRIYPKVLYDVLLEFDWNERYGDLNENIVRGRYVVTGIGGLHANLNGSIFDFEVEMPRWDTEGIDFDNPAEVMAKSKNLVLNFSRHSSDFSLQSYGQLPSDGSVHLDLALNLINPLGAESSYIANAIQKLLYDSVHATGLVFEYMKKVDVIFSIIDEAKASIMANRNLGEDLFRINAVKIEEIALCADIDLRADADANAVQAQIFHDIEDFLSPTIFFNSLSEMYAKGKSTDEIFEGPLLQHGFIDEADMNRTTRRKTLHVSDLINIIMDVDGVVAVRDVRVANIPLDNNNNIPSKEVRWCLSLNVDKQYVPRLTIERSHLSFFKDKLPYTANVIVSNELLDTLREADRPQKLHDTQLDLPVPTGEYREIESYSSIQGDFPLVYGIGSAGLPATANTQRRAQALQLKGFLMFFDQLLANYLSQLAHVKDIFSIDPGKDVNGDYVIDRTYFTQTLVNIVPDAAPLYKFLPATHADHLQEMAEDRASYFTRRNRVLDHLAARFSEQFTDYALLVYNIDGAKAPEELLDDKLAFLNNYPLISSARDKGFNYRDPAKLWHVDNVSGMARRVSYLAGFDPQLPSQLVFSSNVEILPNNTADGWYLRISDPNVYPPAVLVSMDGADGGYATLDEARLAMELLIVNGAQEERYFVVVDDANHTPVNDFINPPSGPYRFVVRAGDTNIGISSSSFLTVDDVFTGTTSPVAYGIRQSAETCRTELLDNTEANRNNYGCTVMRYVEIVNTTGQTGVPPCPDYYEIEYVLNDGHFDATPSPTALLYGTLSDNVDPLSMQTAYEQGLANTQRLLLDMIEHAMDTDYYTYTFNSGSGLEEFNVVDRCGKVLATSSETGFSAHIIKLSHTTPINGHVFHIRNSTGNNLNGAPYAIIGATPNPLHPERLDFKTSVPIPSTVADGELTMKMVATLLPGTIHAEGYIDAPVNFRHVIYPGDTILLSDNAGNEITYTAVRIESTGTNASRIHVLEAVIPSLFEAPVQIVTERSYTVVNVDVPSGIFTVEHRADVEAVKEMAEYLRLKFFDHEGMHVVEHILLRPKLNMIGNLQPINADNRNELDWLDESLGSAFFTMLIEGASGVPLINSTTEIVFQGINLVTDFPAGRQFRILNSTYNNGTYTVADAQLSGGDTIVTLSTPLQDDTTPHEGDYLFSVVRPITTYSVDGISIVVNAPGLEYATVYNGIVRISDSQEGMNNGTYYLSGPASSMDNVNFTLTFNKTGSWQSTLGKAVYVKKFTSYTVDNANNGFILPGDFMADLPANTRIRIEGSSMNDGDYTVKNSSILNLDTLIKVLEPIPDGTPDGTIAYSVSRPIVSYIVGSGTDIIVDDRLLAGVTIDSNTVFIIGSRDGVNDGKYVLGSAPSTTSTGWRFHFSQRMAMYRDPFLPIDVDGDCESCRVTDPYSYVVDVLVPSWQGRFRNHDFRAFIERTIRLETPAHIAVNICWPDCDQMKDFEYKYKNWLLENSRKDKEPQALSFALTDLLEVLAEIRSQYPRGTLHSCDEDPKLKNSIVLNNSALGTF